MKLYFAQHEEGQTRIIEKTNIPNYLSDNRWKVYECELCCDQVTKYIVEQSSSIKIETEK